MTRDRPGQLVAILAAEAAIGYPAAMFERVGHPVTWIGSLIGRLDREWNHGSAARRRVAGVAALATVCATAAAAGWIVERGPRLLVILAGTTGLAQRSLHDHVASVLSELDRGDLPAARIAVARIVGRDTGNLDEAGIAAAAIESLAESFCDGVVAPAFWLAAAGLPGLFAAKAINTADSMIGHRDARYTDFGWAAARADDMVNFVPARLAGALVALAGRGGWAVMARDAPAHASPNGGWPEAAMAGALGRRLGGPVSYEGEPADRATLGDGPAPDAASLAAALRVYRHACLGVWLVAGVRAWRR
ncbi:MAG: adenosylcobinamide-phosphate synthase CbiB [Janthinobacterium lividum]